MVRGVSRCMVVCNVCTRVYFMLKVVVCEVYNVCMIVSRIIKGVHMERSV